MKIYFTNQAAHFREHLAQLVSQPVMQFDKSELKEKISIIDIPTGKALAQLNLAFLFDYHIFPAHIMSCLTQWEQEKRKMKIGDTILQQVFLPPVSSFSQKIVFGVRINRLIDETDIKGFSYETLEGHVEKGESAFTVENRENKLIFKITTWSAPGNLLTQLVGPIFTRPYQTYCTQKALDNVKRQLARNDFETK